MRPDKPAKSVHRAKRFRRQLSLPEAMLWQCLRGSPNGYRVRKQHPAGPYILDFFCARANLAIDIDGISHDMGNQPARDDRRDQFLRTHPARDVLDSVESVAQSIREVVESRLAAFGKTPPSSLRDATSPSQVDGEDHKDRL